MNRTDLLKHILTLTASALLTLTAGAGAAAAQSATPTATTESEEIRRLREEKARAELERDIAVAEKAEFDAKFPKPSTTPLAGETKVNEGAVIESEMVSYVSMAYAANRMVERFTNLEGADPAAPKRRLAITSLAIYNKADVDLLLNYKAVNSQLDVLRLEFCRQLPPGTPECPTDAQGKLNAKVATAPLAALSSFLGAFVDMTALLRTNVVIQGHTFSIEEASLVAEVFRALRATDGYGESVKLYYPAVFPPLLNAEAQSELLGRLEDLNKLKIKLSLQTRPLEDRLKQVVELKEKIASLTAFINTAPAQIRSAEDELVRLERLRKETEDKGWRVPFDVLERIERLRETIVKIRQKQLTAPRDLQAAKDSLIALGSNDPDNDQLEGQLRQSLAAQKAISGHFDLLVSNLTKTDSTTGINTLTAYLRAEQLRSALDGQNSYWLQLNVVKAGGNNRIKTNLVVDIFTGGSRLSHSGGVIVQYNLYDPDGRSIVSDTLTEYTGYTKAGRVKRLTNPVKVEDRPKRKETHP